MIEDEDLSHPDEEDYDDDAFLSDPRQGTIAGWLTVLHVIAKYKDGGLNAPYNMHPEHDVIYLMLTREEVTVNSDDGRLLRALGCHYDAGVDTWAMFESA